jgi:hypothetical protein
MGTLRGWEGKVRGTVRGKVRGKVRGTRYFLRKNNKFPNF